MRLNFNAFEFDAKGLPRVFSLRVSPSYTGEGPVTVSILLDSCERSAVAKWAKRMGVEVVDLKPYQSRPGDRWTHTYEAVLDDKECRVRVWTSLDLEAAADPVEVDTAMHWPAPGLRTTTMCDGEPLGVESFAVLESDVTCPRCRAQLAPGPGEAENPAAARCQCGCTAAFCRCSEPETCLCKPACPVCDRDGGA